MQGQFNVDAAAPPRGAPPRLLLTGEMNPPPRGEQGRGQAGAAPLKPDERLDVLPRLGAVVPAVRGPGTPPDERERDRGLARPRPVSRGTPPGSRGGARPRSRGGPGAPGGPGGDVRDLRELEERLVVAESQNAAQAARLRNLERRVAVSEAARKEEMGGERGEMDALESRVNAMQQAASRAESLMAEFRGRMEAAEADVKENRAMAMRVEQAAQVAMVGARDSFDQIQQRIGIEQGSDARRLDQLSAEIARLTRDVADARGEDSAKRQILEANIARVEGQRNSDGAVQQMADMRAKVTTAEETVRTMAEQLMIEKQARAEADARFESTVARMEEASHAREQALLRRFERDLEDKMAELSRKVVDESEEAALRDQDIIREKDDQMNAFEQGSKKERQRNIEHQMVLEKAIREEHAARVAQMDVVTKALDRVNHDVVALIQDEKVAREARESKLRGQISQSVIKLHEANRETREKLQEERDGIHQLLKTEIRARLATLGTIETTVKKTQSETERLLAAGRVEAAQALRTAEVKLSRRLTATEGRVEVEVAALRKLYARQTQLEIDLDVFKRDVVQAFEAMQEDVTVAAVAQALNTEADNVQAEYVTDTVEDLQDIIETQDARDKATAEELKAAVFGPGPYGEPGLRDRADSTEAAVASAFDKLSQHTIELDRVREAAADDKKEVESLLEELKEEMDYNVAATMVETETLQNQLDIQAAEVAGAADMIESKLREKVSELAERNKEGIERIRAEMHLPLQNLRSAIDAEVAARARTDGDVAKCVADRDAAVAALWTAMEANHVAHALQIECAMIDSEEFALSMADAHDANVAEEAAARNEGFERLRDYVAAAVAEEAAERRRGDDAVRRAYEDDIANLEDTAAEAVRELREGLRDEVATRTHQAETLHRDLASTLDKARSRLEADVRALEETAAGNIAAQKLEEEMLPRRVGRRTAAGGRGVGAAADGRGRARRRGASKIGPTPRRHRRVRRGRVRAGGRARDGARADRRGFRPTIRYRQGRGVRGGRRGQTRARGRDGIGGGGDGEGVSTGARGRRQGGGGARRCRRRSRRHGRDHPGRTRGDRLRGIGDARTCGAIPRGEDRGRRDGRQGGGGARARRTRRGRRGRRRGSVEPSRGGGAFAPRGDGGEGSDASHPRRDGGGEGSDANHPRGDGGTREDGSGGDAGVVRRARRRRRGGGSGFREKGDGPQRGGDGGVAGGRHERGGGVGGRGKERR